MDTVQDRPDSKRRPGWFTGFVGLALDPLLGLLILFPHIGLFRRFLRRLDTPLRRRRGAALILGGIEGPSAAQVRAARGLLRGRWRGAIHIVEWNRGVPLLRPIVNLTSRARHERSAEELVGEIRAHRLAYPGTTIGVLSESGGCWVLIRALEKLADADESIDVAVLAAAAVSPHYDLRRAAAACRAPLLSIRSLFDWFMLGLGTMLFGTADRRHCRGAGLVGWKCAKPEQGPPDGAASQRPLGHVAMLTWTPEWVQLGHLGGHCTSAAPGVVARYVAPRFNNAGSLAIQRAGEARLLDRVEDDPAGRQPDFVVDAR